MSPEFALALFVPLGIVVAVVIAADVILEDGLIDFFERLLGGEE